jgi:hypothetical protein
VSDAKLELLQRFFPLMVVEYERIGIADEMLKYFSGSGGEFTEADCERWLTELKAIPSGLGFDDYCALVGMDAAEIRRYHEESLRPPDVDSG